MPGRKTVARRNFYCVFRGNQRGRWFLKHRQLFNACYPARVKNPQSQVPVSKTRILTGAREDCTARDKTFRWQADKLAGFRIAWFLNRGWNLWVLGERGLCSYPKWQSNPNRKHGESRRQSQPVFWLNRCRFVWKAKYDRHPPMNFHWHLPLLNLY